MKVQLWKLFIQYLLNRKSSKGLISIELKFKGMVVVTRREGMMCIQFAQKINHSCIENRHTLRKKEKGSTKLPHKERQTPNIGNNTPDANKPLRDRKPIVIH